MAMQLVTEDTEIEAHHMVVIRKPKGDDAATGWVALEGAYPLDVARTLAKRSNASGYVALIVYVGMRASDPRGAALTCLHDIRQALWPKGNPDASWSPDTVEAVADALAAHGFGGAG